MRWLALLVDIETLVCLEWLPLPFVVQRVLATLAGCYVGIVLAECVVQQLSGLPLIATRLIRRRVDRGKRSHSFHSVRRSGKLAARLSLYTD